MSDLKCEPPTLCIHCKMSSDDMEKMYGIGFMLFAEPNSTMIFFQCPNCHALMGNVHAADNTKQLLKEREGKRSILAPRKSNLVLPPGYSQN